MRIFLQDGSCRYFRVSLIQERNLDYVGLEKSIAIFDPSSLVKHAKIVKIAKIGQFWGLCKAIERYLFCTLRRFRDSHCFFNDDSQ